MSAFIRKISKIGIILTVMMFCVGIASAATYDKYGRDLEKETGYISVQKLVDNPERFKAIPHEEGTIYIDKDSITVIKDDIFYRVLEYKTFIVTSGDSAEIILDNVLLKFDVQADNPILAKHLYTTIYDYDGAYLGSQRHNKRMFPVPEGTYLYGIANGIYALTYGDFYNEAFKQRVEKEAREEKAKASGLQE